MRLTLRVILLAVAIAGCVWLWFYLHPTPEEAIRRMLKDVARSVSYEKPGGMIAAAARAEKLSAHFAREVYLTIDLPELSHQEASSREEIAMWAMKLRSYFHSLKVELLDPNITLGGDKQSALVDFTLRVEAAGDKYLVAQEMRFYLREVDGEWIIRRVETVRTLYRAPIPRLRAIPASA
jgi:hypothetical protein